MVTHDQMVSFDLDPKQGAHQISSRIHMQFPALSPDPNILDYAKLYTDTPPGANSPKQVHISYSFCTIARTPRKKASR